MSRSSVPLSELLNKMKHYDKDERYMATLDLCEILKNHNASSSSSSSSSLRLDANNEHVVCRAVLSLLEDPSNDVQSVAVKTLGELLRTVHERQAVEIAARLCSLVTDSSRDELRDVYAIGLRTLVGTVPARAGDAVAGATVGRILEGLRASSSSSSTTCCLLDVLTDLLKRFGSDSAVLARQHGEVSSTVSAMVLSRNDDDGGGGGGSGVDRDAVRKRAGNCLGELAVSLPDAALDRLVETLLTRVDDGRRAALVQTVCVVSGKVGRRLSGKIDAIVPVFLRFCKPEDAEKEVDDNDDDDEEESRAVNELRESCFASFESIVSNCPEEVQGKLPDIIRSALAFMRYDMNYSYGDEDEDDEDGDSDNNEVDDTSMADSAYSDDYSDGDYSDDDDDDSWKVRRSAVRTLSAVVRAVKNEPSTLWTTEYPYYGKKKKSVAGALVDRFKERDVDCRVDVMECFTELLKVTIEASKTQAVAFASASSGDNNAMDTADDAAKTIDLHSTYVPTIVKVCHTQLTEKKGGEKTKSSALTLLSILCTVPGGLGGREHVRRVFGEIRTLLENPATVKTLKLDALRLTRTILSCGTHDENDLRESLVEVLLPSLCAAVREDWYKVIAEALRVLAEIPRLTAEATDAAVAASVAEKLYEAIHPRLAAHDLDQEIKEHALLAAARLLEHCHPSLSTEAVNETLVRTQDRLENETTRAAALRALSTVAAAGVPLTVIMSDVLKETSSLLRQQNRGVKQSATETLHVVVTHQGDVIVQRPELSALMGTVLKEMGGVVVESDVHLSHLCLTTAVAVLTRVPGCEAAVVEHVLPRALDLSNSALLQDAALDSLLSFYETLAPHTDTASLIQSLRSKSFPDKATKQALTNLAQCVAVVCAVAPDNVRRDTVKDLMACLSDSSDARRAQLALLTLGEIGRRLDLSKDVVDDVSRDLVDTCLALFASSSADEEVRHAAAYALGRGAVGCRDVFLAAVLRALETSPGRGQYLLLSALKEFVAVRPPSLSADAPAMTPHLFRHDADEEEGVRTMVAECLGGLACHCPEAVLPAFAERVTNVSADADPKAHSRTCWTVATAVKIPIAARPTPPSLLRYLPTYLTLLRPNPSLSEEDSLSVRNAALVMVYSAVHHAPELVSGLMAEHILPSLYELALLNLERKIDMGCFKHTVDVALPSRKTSFGIFATALENCPASLDVPAFLPILAKGLSDKEDVQLRSHQIVAYMCEHHPAAVGEAVDDFVEALRKTITKKTGSKTGIELERANESIKSGLRTILALKRVNQAMSSKKFRDLVEFVENNQKFNSLRESLLSEN